MAPSDNCVRSGVVGLQLDRFREQGQCLIRISRHGGISIGQGSQIKVIGVEAVGPFASSTFNLGLAERRLDYPGHADGHPVLKIEYIFERTVEAISPEMGADESVN